MSNLVRVEKREIENRVLDLDKEVSYFIRNQRSKQTGDIYLNELKLFFNWVQRSPGEITKEDVIDYKEYLEMRGLKPSTVKRKLSILSQFFKFISPYLESDPTEGVKLPEVSTESPYEILTVGEVGKILSTVDRSTTEGKRNFLIIMLMVTKGLRVSEVINVKVEDFKEVGEYRVLTVLGKGNKSRGVKILDREWGIIDDYISSTGLQRDDYLFMSMRPHVGRKGSERDDRGKRITRQMVWYVVKRFMSELGIDKDISPHSLRHTFGTYAVIGGSTITKLSQSMGHSSIRTTQRYVRNVDYLQDNPVDYLPYAV